MIYKHKQRGSLYKIVDYGKVQTGSLLADNSDVVIYRDTLGRHWVRPPKEFHDGRFEKQEHSALNLSFPPEPPTTIYLVILGFCMGSVFTGILAWLL